MSVGSLREEYDCQNDVTDLRGSFGIRKLDIQEDIPCILQRPHPLFPSLYLSCLCLYLLFLPHPLFSTQTHTLRGATITNEAPTLEHPATNRMGSPQGRPFRKITCLPLTSTAIVPGVCVCV